MLGINPEKVRQVITEARMFDAKDEDCDPDSGSNGADDMMADVLEDTGNPENDAIYQELTEYIRSLDEEEQNQSRCPRLAWPRHLFDWRMGRCDRRSASRAQQANRGIPDYIADAGRLS